MERIENIGFGKIKLIQNPAHFCYGVDAVILADFASMIYPDYVDVIDLGSGNGVIPFILAHKGKLAQITGIEIQPQAVDMARRSCKMNDLEERVKFIEADVAHLIEEGGMQSAGLKAESYDMVCCNPPYFARGGAIANSKMEKFIARHETSADIEDFIELSAKLLKKGGHLFMVHRPSRLVDIIYFARKHRMEAKHMRLVVPKPGQSANIVLIHFVKGGGKELKVMPELPVYQEDGKYSYEIRQIYTEARTPEI